MSPNPISLAITVVLAGLGVLAIMFGRLVVPGAVLIGLAVIVLAALRMAQQWEQAVILRAGKFLAVKGPGLFGIVPIVDRIAAMIDTRLRTTQFVAEQTLTKDTCRSMSTRSSSGSCETRSAPPSKSRVMRTRSAGRRRPRCAR
jgi:hypothetical protein